MSPASEKTAINGRGLFVYARCSGVFVPVDKELPPDDIINVLNNTASTVLFYSESYEQLFRGSADRLPRIQHFIGFDRTADDGSYMSFDAFLAGGRKLAENDPGPYLSQKSDPNALKLLVYTSGTTGLAKGVMLSEHNLVSLVYHGLQIQTVYDTCLSVLPYHHTYESYADCLFRFNMHSTICINDKLRAVLKKYAAVQAVIYISGAGICRSVL